MLQLSNLVKIVFIRIRPVYQVSVYRAIGPLVFGFQALKIGLSETCTLYDTIRLSNSVNIITWNAQGKSQ